MSGKSETKPRSGKSRKDYRRLTDAILPLAAGGGMSFHLLKNLSALLMDFFGSDWVEAVFREKGKILHSDARRDGAPAFFCSVVQDADPSPDNLFSCLKSPPSDGRKSGGDSTSVLPIQVGAAIQGYFLLGFHRRVDRNPNEAELLKDVGTAAGLALSHNLSQFELRERIKELTCMHDIAHLAARPNQKISDLLKSIVRVLPPAYLYPDIAEACIVFDGESYETDGFTPTKIRQSADILMGERVCGRVEVDYRESRPEMDEGPFLAEERRLLDSVAREIGVLIERRQAEKEQTRLQEQLRHADRLATIGQLAAGVAHELNEPLTGILGFAELLKVQPGIPDAPRSDIGRIEAAALHAREVVRKLLLFAKQIPPRRRRVDVNHVVNEAVSFFGGRCAKENVVIDLKLDPALPAVDGDEGQIRQVVVNLVVNAIQAMPGGGRLMLRTAANHAEILLSVADTGTGMTEEVKEKIFLPFFTTKPIDQGTGLGLPVVHGIIKAHRGRIEVDSRPGRGTRFDVHLPFEVHDDDSH